jgi:hypothetical protein
MFAVLLHLVGGAAFAQTSNSPRRCLVLGPPLDRGSYSNLLFVPDAEVLNVNRGAEPNLKILRDSNATWVRLWADWTKLQPGDPAVQQPGDPLNPPFRYDFVNIDTNPETRELIKNLDQQIRVARLTQTTRGGTFKVVLTAYAFPVWSHGFTTDPMGMDRNPAYRVPADRTVFGPWGKWMRFLVERYGFSQEKANAVRDGTDCRQAGNFEHPACVDYRRYVDFIEVTNEPNTQMWPQREPDSETGRLVMPLLVAEMFDTAQEVVTEQNAKLRREGRLGSAATTVSLTGPGTLDAGGGRCQGEDRRGLPCQNPMTCTTYGRFSTALLRALRERDFRAKSYFAWSHHNYRDVECDREVRSVVRNGQLATPDYPSTNSAAWVRRLLVVGVDEGRDRYRWTGWPRAGRPELLLTEGGARLNGLVEKYSIDFNDYRGLKNKQAALVKRNFDRMSDERGLGEGIAMVSQYLTYTDPCFDSGLFDYVYSCEPVPGSNKESWEQRATQCGLRRPDRCSGQYGRKRPLFDVWRRLPSAP